MHKCGRLEIVVVSLFGFVLPNNEFSFQRYKGEVVVHSDWKYGHLNCTQAYNFRFVIISPVIFNLLMEIQFKFTSYTIYEHFLYIQKVVVNKRYNKLLREKKRGTFKNAHFLCHFWNKSFLLTEIWSSIRYSHFRGEFISYPFLTLPTLSMSHHVLLDFVSLLSNILSLKTVSWRPVSGSGWTDVFSGRPS